MTFDWTVSLGNLVTVIGFVCSGVAFVMLMRGDMMVLGTRIGAVEDAIKDMAHANLLVAGQGARIETLDERLNIVSRRLDEFIGVALKSAKNSS